MFTAVYCASMLVAMPSYYPQMPPSEEAYRMSMQLWRLRVDLFPQEFKDEFGNLVPGYQEYNLPLELSKMRVGIENDSWIWYYASYLNNPNLNPQSRIYARIKLHFLIGEEAFAQGRLPMYSRWFHNR